MVAPRVLVSKVVGCLQSHYLSVVVAHFGLAEQLCRRKCVPLIIVEVDTVCSGECQAIADVELQVDVTSYHCTVAVALVSVDKTIRVSLDVVVRVLVVVAVSISHLHCRRVVQTYPNRVRLVLSEACCTAILRTREVSVCCELQPLVELVVDIELNSVALRLCVAYYTRLIHIVGREVCLCALCTLRDSYLVVLCNAGVEQLIHPVDTLV